jgi:hypothetical protein
LLCGPQQQDAIDTVASTTRLTSTSRFLDYSEPI